MSPSFYYVYIITNNITGKQYVGSRICYKENMNADKYMGSSKYLKKDYEIYGITNFTKKIIKDDYENASDMLDGETYYILKHNTLFPYGYNRFLPNKNKGFYRNGYSTYDTWVEKYGKEIADKKLEDLNKKIQIATKIAMHKPEIRAKVIGHGLFGKDNGMFGHIYTEETKKKQSDYAKNRPEEHRNNLKNSLKGKQEGEKNGMFGKHHREETKKKLGEKTKAVPKIQCQYCLGYFYPWHYVQYHGEKCKLK
jgi:NUMOD3 motif